MRRHQAQALWNVLARHKSQMRKGVPLESTMFPFLGRSASTLADHHAANVLREMADALDEIDKEKP